MNVPAFAPSPCTASFNQNKENVVEASHDTSNLKNRGSFVKPEPAVFTCQQSQGYNLAPTKLTDENPALKKYTIGRILSDDGFCQELEVFDPMTGTACTAKRFKKARFNDCWDRVDEVDQELQVLEKVDHPNVIKMHELIHTSEFLLVVMEKNGKDLFTYAQENELDERALCEIAFGVINGLAHLHSLGICHMDLSPDSISVMRDVPVDELKREHIKLCNFKNATIRDVHDECVEVWETGFIGSHGFFAPEMVLDPEFVLPGHELYRFRYDARFADMWSFGCIFFFLAGQVPIEWTHAYDHFYFEYDLQGFRQGIEQVIKKGWDRMPLKEKSPIVELILACLRMDPKQRESASGSLALLQRAIEDSNIDSQMTF